MTKIDPAIKNKGRKSVKDTKKTGFLGSTKMNRAIKKKKMEGGRGRNPTARTKILFRVFFSRSFSKKKVEPASSRTNRRAKGGGSTRTKAIS